MQNKSQIRKMCVSHILESHGSGRLMCALLLFSLLFHTVSLYIHEVKYIFPPDNINHYSKHKHSLSRNRCKYTSFCLEKQTNQKKRIALVQLNMSNEPWVESASKWTVCPCHLQFTDLHALFACSRCPVHGLWAPALLALEVSCSLPWGPSVCLRLSAWLWLYMVYVSELDDL